MAKFPWDSRDPFIIGIAGGSGSGKTVLSRAILDHAGADRVVLIPHDNYYKDRSQIPFEERRKINYDVPEALDNRLLIMHLESLRSGKSVEMPVYDFKTNIRTTKRILVTPKRLIVVEGILVLAEESLRRAFDLKIFVDTAPDIRFIRRLQRDVQERGHTMESVIQQYLQKARPMHYQYVEPSRSYADYVVSGDSSDMHRTIAEILDRTPLEGRF